VLKALAILSSWHPYRLKKFGGTAPLILENLRNGGSHGNISHTLVCLDTPVGYQWLKAVIQGCLEPNKVEKPLP